MTRLLQILLGFVLGAGIAWQLCDAARERDRREWERRYQQCVNGFVKARQ